jgi:hypothetical protein
MTRTIIAGGVILAAAVAAYLVTRTDEPARAPDRPAEAAESESARREEPPARPPARVPDFRPAPPVAEREPAAPAPAPATGRAPVAEPIPETGVRGATPIAAARDAVRRNPQDTAACLGLAKAHHERGEYRAALSVLKRAARMNPSGRANPEMMKLMRDYRRDARSRSQAPATPGL